MTQQDTNIDDYYSHIPTEDTGSDLEKKSAFKLKIKAKKPESESAPAVAEEKEPVVVEEKEPVVVEEKPKIIIKKQPSIITFEERKIVKPEKIEEKPISQREERPFHSRDDNRPKFGDKPFFKKDNTQTIARPANEGFVKKEEPKATVSADITANIIPKAPSESIDSKNLERFSTGKKKGFGDKKAFEPGKKSFTDFSSDDNNSRYKGKKFFKQKGFSDDDDGTFRRAKKSSSEKREKNIEDFKQVLTDKSGQEVFLPDFLTVKEFSEKIGVPISKIISEFLKNGMMVNLNTRVDFDTCFIISEVFNIKAIKEQKDDVSIASVLSGNLEDLLKNDDTAKMVTRAPIISIMGHVDHGKTSILDYIRKTEVAAGEAGGITQKIGAYQIEKNGKKITFLDTPGHEAFSIMRARGAKLTDIAIIVVAADEGMKPQTIESINHAKQANVPIIVAINKMDKPGANIDFVKGQLAEQGLQSEDWGGDVVVVPVSAHTGLGIETLLEMIILVSDMQEFKADPTRSAIATVIESHLDNKLGPLATILINSGTLRKGDYVVCSNSYGRLRFLKDYKGKNIDEAGPSTPVLISGLSQVVEGGDILQVTSDIESAKIKAHEFELVKSSKRLNQFEGASLELLLNRIKTGNLKQLKVVVKADSNGSLEALKDALYKQGTNEIKIQIIHSGVGEINNSDVIMAGTSQAILIAYNVGIIPNARQTLQNSKIEFINKKVIYHILEKIESIVTGMIDIKHDDVDLGEAKVKAIFFTSKDRMVIGCELKDGKVESRAKVRVIRDGKKAGNGDLIGLKHGVMDVNEITEGEFGIAFKGEAKIEIGDTLEFYKVVQRK